MLKKILFFIGFLVICFVGIMFYVGGSAQRSVDDHYKAILQTEAKDHEVLIGQIKSGSHPLCSENLNASACFKKVIKSEPPDSNGDFLVVVALAAELAKIRLC